MRRPYLMDALETRLFLRNIFVDMNAPGPYTGNSWENAYKSARVGMGVALPGDNVYIANGTYTPSDGTPNRLRTFRISYGVTVRGGYNGYGSPNPWGRGQLDLATTLSGEIGTSAANDNSYNVITVDGVEGKVVIEGFKIANGYNTETGAGAMLHQSNVEFRNVRFVNNFSGLGGAIEVNTADSRFISTVIKNATFINNRAHFAGGAIYARTRSNGPLYIKNSTFINNVTDDSNVGAAIYSKLTHPNSYDGKKIIEIENCNFSNHGSGSGRIVSLQGGGDVLSSRFIDNDAAALEMRSIGKVVSSTFTNNDSPSGASGARLLGKIFLIDSTFTRNDGTDKGSAVQLDEGATVINCQFWQNTGGPAIFAENEGGRVDQSRFVGNPDGAIAIEKGSVTNSVFIGNGKAIFIDADNVDFDLINNTFTRNLGESGAVINLGSSQNAVVRVTNSIVWDNQSTFHAPASADLQVKKSIVQGGSSGAGNLSSNPKFVQAPAPGADMTWGTSDDILGNLKLQSSSPAINAGEAALDEAFAYNDFVNGLRTSGVSVDMGAYEYQLAPFAIFLTGSLAGQMSITGTAGADLIRFESTDLGLNGFYKDFGLASLNEISIRYYRKKITGHKIHGGDGNDTIRGSELDDSIFGEGGDDELYGSGRVDSMDGGSGNDTLFGGKSLDYMYGGPGQDFLQGNEGNDRMYGGDGHDSLFGDVGEDRLFGQAGNDMLFGAAGDDTIDGGEGSDTSLLDENDTSVSIENVL